jgi:exopolysaccharide biosynthesis polyprenyl glycosylphosphotransferase
MPYSKWRLMKNVAKLYDLLVLIVAFVLASFVLYSSTNGMTLSEFMALRVTLGNGLRFGLLLLAWHNLFILCGLYDSKRLTPCLSEAYEVCRATLLASLFLLFSAKVLHIQMVTPIFAVSMWVICTAAMISGRLVARALLVFLRRRGRNRRYLVIVGTNERAMEFADTIRKRPELGYNIVGFIDDDWEGTHRFEATGQLRCCTFSGLAEFLRHNVVDEAAIYLPLRSYYVHAAQLVSLCEQHGIVIRTDPQTFKLRTRNSMDLDIHENSQVMAVAGSIQAWPAAMKRFIDLVGSLILLTLLSPLFLVVGLLVALSSEGPILFRQTRIGLNKRHFTIYKFRTMVADAERVQNHLLSMNEMTGPVFKIKEDPRVTPLGKVLRKTSIDELPQLFNVLKGEMSLVGPRAMSLRDYQLFDQDWHRRRFSVKPGITCLWQVCGRNSIPFEKWMELDLQYIDKWSLWLDLQILARTVPAVWRGTGAA